MSERVLDPCCGSRMMWLDRTHPDVVFGDRRSETITVTDRSHGNASGTRTLRIEPDVLLDFRALPYPDGTFKLVAFDPPHLVKAGPRSWLAAKYGKLGDDWREDNCIGCPKGGEGYWNHVRKVHPIVFQKRMERQESIGPGAYFFRDRATGERFGLKDLDPKAGRHDEPLPACSFFCEMAEQEYSA